jgi:hypothetical protein
MIMTQQEAYAELRRRIDEINQMEVELKAFAKEHNLSMGRSKSRPFPLETVDPDYVEPERPKRPGPGASEEELDAYYEAIDRLDNRPSPDDWLHSSVCW